MEKNKVGNYLQGIKIGAGQFGQVFKGINLQTNEEVAIKRISQSLLVIPKAKQLLSQEVKTYIVRIFENQIQLMQHLNESGNQNILKLVEYFEEGTYHYIITEYCEGGDLGSYLKKNKFIPEHEAIKHFKEILHGFKTLHQYHIMHRDFKCENIFIKNNQYKIGDFGFAKQLQMEAVVNSEQPQDHTILGTPYFMAPELLLKQKYTNKTDIWALGVVFYNMLFGQLPYLGFSKEIILQKIKDKQISYEIKNIKISQQTQDLLSKMLEPNPVNRITWEDLLSHSTFGDFGNQIDVNEIANFYKNNELFQGVKEINYDGQVKIFFLIVIFIISLTSLKSLSLKQIKIKRNYQKRNIINMKLIKINKQSIQYFFSKEQIKIQKIIQFNQCFINSIIIKQNNQLTMQKKKQLVILMINCFMKKCLQI